MPGVRVVLAGAGAGAGAGVSPGAVVEDASGVSVAIVVDVSPGAPPRLPAVVPEARLGPTTFEPLLLWELLCCVPPTAPPTTPPIIRMMMMTIVVMPHLVRYHGAFFVMRLPFSSCPSLRAMATAPGL